MSGTQRYFADFDNYEGVKGSFGNPDDFPTERNLLLARYDNNGYDGSAFMLFRRGRKLFEVNASHCSCYGLAEGWSPEETTKEALRLRKDIFREGDYGYTKRLIQIIGE